MKIKTNCYICKNTCGLNWRYGCVTGTQTTSITITNWAKAKEREEKKNRWRWKKSTKEYYDEFAVTGITKGKQMPKLYEYWMGISIMRLLDLVILVPNTIFWINLNKNAFIFNRIDIIMIKDMIECYTHILVYKLRISLLFTVGSDDHHLQALRLPIHIHIFRTLIEWCTAWLLCVCVCVWCHFICFLDFFPPQKYRRSDFDDFREKSVCLERNWNVNEITKCYKTNTRISQYSNGFWLISFLFSFPQFIQCIDTSNKEMFERLWARRSDSVRKFGM